MPGFNIGGYGGTNDPPSLVEVARSHRWELRFPDYAPDMDVVCMYAQAVTRPSFEVDRITINHRQNELYLPGKNRAGTINITLYETMKDGAPNGAAQSIRNWWSQWMMTAHQYRLNMPAVGNKASIQGIKKTIDAQMVDGCGNPVWLYRMRGAWPMKVQPSDLEYTSTELSSLVVTVSIDAFQEGQSAGDLNQQSQLAD